MANVESEAGSRAFSGRAFGERARDLEMFAERLFARIPPYLAARLDDAGRLALAKGAFEFFLVRNTPVKVRVTEAAGDSALSVVETVMADRPFIVDSVVECFHYLGLPLRALLHPILNVARDGEGRLVSLESASAGERPESFVHVEAEVAGLISAQAIEREIAAALAEVSAATDDFAAMTGRALQICEETAAMRGMVEVRDFLRWLVGGAFVFLGYRRYRVEREDESPALVVEPDSGLGVLRAEGRSRFARPVALGELAPVQRALLLESPPLIIGKTRGEARVHRRRPMDDVTIRRAGADGRLAAFDRFIGLFTSKAYAEESQHIPFLRAKLREVLELERARPGSHDFKEIISTFNSFPKEELFRASVAEIREQLSLILDVKSESAVRLSVYADPARGSVTALVVMPREAFSAEVRKKIQEELGRGLDGRLLYYYLALGESYTARLHFGFAAEAPSAARVGELEVRVAALARSWEDRLRHGLVHRFGARRGHALAARYASAFSADYQASTAVETALADIDNAEALLADGALRVELTPAGAGSDEQIGEIRFFESGEPLRLSVVMPMLLNFGVEVLSEASHEVTPLVDGRRGRVFLQAFRVRGAGGQALLKMPGRPLLAEALEAVRVGRAEDDELNALVLASGFSWREVALLRTYLATAFQMRLAPAHPALRRVFVLNPRLARHLVDYFVERFDPAREPNPARLSSLRATYVEQLSAIDNIAEDRIARTIFGMVEATVRTNYFCAPVSSESYIALKFESARIPGLADTPPLYEIHVNSPRMEGCHLRAGRIARGGIRLSDRADDYRTEILDLMKTQTVKNALIVPTGAKGGFVVKRRAGAPAGEEEVIEAYQTLINAMLDLTDNRVDGRVMQPEGVRVYDQDGPYLVVAADKGTARFSDIANQIAQRRGFWLADAFASGGEHGYDHKAMGITARGAWESVKWHLREMGREVGRGAPITMVGIGDMSGDVFGNGLLQSDNLKLIAAFDHRHIFIDPDPDPAKSFAERKRLYSLANSQWSDYDPQLISRGGGVYRRGQKSVRLSHEARVALGCEEEALDADGLVRAILRADVDLLYNGGIGTYVRASDETEAEVGDHANDACRITAAELRARVVVEGGNLGLTQRARVEYALGGGAVNTDAIDNSAGVDLSDHEVNLKILFAPLMRSGALDPEERNRLLVAVGADVAARVLRDNRDQVILLSLEQLRSRTRLSEFREHVAAVEERGLLRRYERALPGRETLLNRRARYAGLTRPELALVTAYTKIDLVAQLEDSSLADDPYVRDRFLGAYFPRLVSERFADQFPGYRLRRALVATLVVNELVDLMGFTFVFGLRRDFGASTEEAVRAALVGAGVLELAERAERIKTAPAALTAQARLSALLALEEAGAKASGWALERFEDDLRVGEIIGRLRPPLARLEARFESMLVAGERERFEQSYRQLRAAVFEEGFAHELARLVFARHLLEAVRLGFELKLDPADVAAAYFGLARLVDFAMLEGALDGLVAADRWERRAAWELRGELARVRSELGRMALGGGAGGAGAAVDDIRRGRERRFAEAERLIDELRALGAPGLAALQVAVRALSRLVEPGARIPGAAG